MLSISASTSTLKFGEGARGKREEINFAELEIGVGVAKTVERGMYVWLKARSR
jgi:hypothetical protein